MNPGDVISLLILLIIVGSSLIQSLTKKAPNAGTQKSDRSLSEIKKYLEEMAQGGGTPPNPNPNNPKAKPLYTEPYNAQKKQVPPVQKNVASQRGFEQFLEALPGTAQARPGSKTAHKPVLMSAPNETSSETASQKRSREKEENVSNKNMSPEDQALASKKSKAKKPKQANIFTKFNLPEHLNDVQKAIILSEILSPQKKF